MTVFDTRVYQDSDLEDLLRFVGELVKARLPEPAYMKPSDIAWQIMPGQMRDMLRFWEDANGLAGWAWFQPRSELKFEMRQDLAASTELADLIFDWAEEKRRHYKPEFPRFLALLSMDEWRAEIENPRPPQDDDERLLITSAMDQDDMRRAHLERLGYGPTQHFERCLSRPNDLPIPEPSLAEGLVARRVAEDEFEERVETHRAAWAPAAGFSMERLLEVRAMPNFEPKLDLIVATPSGEFACCCIAWYDPVSETGCFEPMGTRPEWRGKGVTREMIYEGLRRMKALGMTTQTIGTAGFNDAAFSLYRSCGFELTDVERTWTKRIEA